MSIIDRAFSKRGISINSSEFSYNASKETHTKMTLYLEKVKIGRKKINYKLRDWVFSRQRYWGEPIPVYFDEKNSEYTVDENDLPLVLPQMKSGYKPSGTGESPIANEKEWIYFEKDGKTYRRDSNTMPQWAGSCWYYIRYTDHNNSKKLAAEDKIDYWLPVDIYVGGGEHSVLHLLYARFWHKVLYDIGIVNTLEPFIKLINQGMITSFSYRTKDGRLCPNDDVIEKDGSFFHKENNEKLERITTKMSKSLKNVVNPDEVIKEYGADSFRLYEMFLGPLTQNKPWDTAGIQGVKRFLDRVWRIQNLDILEKTDNKELLTYYNKTIKAVNESTKKYNFNIAISHMMVFVNNVYKLGFIQKKMFKNFLIILSPYAPHICEEIWHVLGETESIIYADYPSYDSDYILESNFDLVVQINGKIKEKISCQKGINEGAAKELAINSNKVKEAIEKKEIRKIIFVKDKLINIVVM